MLAGHGPTAGHVQARDAGHPVALGRHRFAEPGAHGSGSAKSDLERRGQGDVETGGDR